MIGGLATMTAADGDDAESDMNEVHSGSDTDDDDDSHQGWLDDGQVDADEAQIWQARQAELDNWEALDVYEIIDEQMARETGHKHLGTRWVNAQRPTGWRSRLVGREFRSIAPSRRGLFTASSSTSTVRVIDLFGACGDNYSMIGDAVNAYLQVPGHD